METEKPLKIAIIQLTRIGDLVQTVQATRQFKAENSNTHITLIARRKFASGLQFLLESVFDDIILFDVKDLLPTGNLLAARNTTNIFLNELNGLNFDVTVNLSFNKSSTYLNTLIESQLTLGLSRNSLGEISINDKWSQFVFSNVMSTVDTPFCLVDIYRYIMGCQDIHVLEDNMNDARKKQIVLHPFASSRKKRWGNNKWTELIYKVARENPDHEIHIVGSPADTPDSVRLIESPALASIKDRIHSHTEFGSISSTYKLLSDSELFIGHDSLVSHLASETLTPTIVISLGSVRPHETTAYQKGVINISPRNSCFPCAVEEQCDILPCHNSINHQSVSAIATGLINKEEIDLKFLTTNLSPFQLDSILVYKTDYEDYGLVLKEISSTNKPIKEVFKDFYKIIWQCFLRDHDINIGLPDVTKECAASLHKYQDGINYLFELYNFGIKYSNKIITEAEQPSPNIPMIQENINKLQEIDQLCNITKKTYPHLAGLIDYFFVVKSNAPGENIIDICKSNLVTYYDASNLAAVLNEFLEKTIAPYVARNTRETEI